MVRGLYKANECDILINGVLRVKLKTDHISGVMRAGRLH